MQNLAQQLPPLDALIAFEAAARLQSFTRAAHELNITQAAVSQRIRSLEAAIGQKLFDRAHRAVSLTPAGREYQHSVALALSHLASATSGIRPVAGAARLTVAADEAIAHLWLMPRLERFAAANPDLSIRLVVSDRLEDCLAEPVDAAIVFGGEQAGGFTCQALFAEEVFPVCAPDYLASHPEIATPEGLAGAHLIDLEDERWDWMNWRIWLTETYGAAPSNPRRLQIASYPLVIDAARTGLGVALGWNRLVDDALARGDLVRPVEEAVRTPYSYNLLTRSGTRCTPAVEAFAAWARQDQEAAAI